MTRVWILFKSRSLYKDPRDARLSVKLREENIGGTRVQNQRSHSAVKYRETVFNFCPPAVLSRAQIQGLVLTGTPPH